jgi:hypothetical protein
MYDAVKGTRAKSPTRTDITQQEKTQKSENIGKFTLNGDRTDGEPQTTIIYAKPTDRIKPTIKRPSYDNSEPDTNETQSFVVSSDINGEAVNDVVVKVACGVTVSDIPVL